MVNPTVGVMQATQGAMGAHARRAWQESTKRHRDLAAAATVRAANTRLSWVLRKTGLVRCVHLAHLHLQEAQHRVTAFAKQDTTNYRVHARYALKENSSRWWAMGLAVAVEWANIQRIWVRCRIRHAPCVRQESLAQLRVKEGIVKNVLPASTQVH